MTSTPDEFEFTEDDEIPASSADPLISSLSQFLLCVANAVPDICSFAIIPGTEYAPFTVDEDHEGCGDRKTGEVCDQMWVRVVGSRVELATNERREQFDGDSDRALIAGLWYDIEVGVKRCYQMEDNGANPSETAVTTDAIQMLTDMREILDAALCCEVWDALNVGMWSPAPVLGGEYGGMWSFSVRLDE